MNFDQFVVQILREEGVDEQIIKERYMILLVIVVFWILSMLVGRLMYLSLFRINEQIEVTSNTVSNMKKLN